MLLSWLRFCLSLPAFPNREGFFSLQKCLKTQYFKNLVLLYAFLSVCMATCSTWSAQSKNVRVRWRVSDRDTGREIRRLSLNSEEWCFDVVSFTSLKLCSFSRLRLHTMSEIWLEVNPSYFAFWVNFVLIVKWSKMLTSSVRTKCFWKAHVFLFFFWSACFFVFLSARSLIGHALIVITISLYVCVCVCVCVCVHVELPGRG